MLYICTRRGVIYISIELRDSFLTRLNPFMFSKYQSQPLSILIRESLLYLLTTFIIKVRYLVPLKHPYIERVYCLAAPLTGFVSRRLPGLTPLLLNDCFSICLWFKSG